MNKLSILLRWIRGFCLSGALGMLAPTFVLADALRIDDAWVRAMPPGQRVTAAYFTVTNAGDTALTVREVQAAGAGRVSLHETRRSEGNVTMESADWPTLAPGESLRLEPGGLHLMLEEVADMPAAGASVSLCLRTDTSRDCVDAPVRRGAKAGSSGHHHHRSSSEGRS